MGGVVGGASVKSTVGDLDEGEPDAEILTKNPKPDIPLIVGFGGKRHVETYGGRIDLDRDEWRRWKAAHTNLLCCWTHIEWDNTVPLTYARATGTSACACSAGSTTG